MDRVYPDTTNGAKEAGPVAMPASEPPGDGETLSSSPALRGLPDRDG